MKSRNDAFTRSLLAAMLLVSAIAGAADTSVTKTETFDRDPHWDGRNNHSDNVKPLKVVQNFGYSATERVGDKTGAIGGLLTPAAEPAFYAKVIPDGTFNEALTASGQFKLAKGGGHILLGFFNADTANEWRTANTLVLRFGGEGDVFNAYVEYCTSHGIAFIPWYPLGAGSLDVSAALAQVARRHTATPLQVALAWLLARAPIMLPIPGTSKVAHLEENVAAADIELSDDEFETLSKAGSASA